MAYKKLTKTIVRNFHNNKQRELSSANNERIVDIDIFAGDTVANVYTVSENHRFYKYIYFLIAGEIVYHDFTTTNF